MPQGAVLRSGSVARCDAAESSAEEFRIVATSPGHASYPERGKRKAVASCFALRKIEELRRNNRLLVSLFFNIYFCESSVRSLRIDELDP